MINNKICGMLGLATRAGQTVFGTEACNKAIEKGNVKLVIVATNASERTKMNFNNICNRKKIPILEILTIDEISKNIGKQNKAVIGVKNSSFSNEILKINNGGEAIG